MLKNGQPLEEIRQPSLTELEKQIELSRIKILQSLTGAEDITFISGVGNIGDQLICVGTRQLLTGIEYREINVLEIEGKSGDLALMTSGGAWCLPYHEIMPSALRVIEENFRQVIILPSSFDTSVNCVREALERTRALVFARERPSYDQIRKICRADIAHDCAFFFDYRPYRAQGSGVLNAFRTDLEAVARKLPTDNTDISLTCKELEEWLRTIAQYEVVRTDRAHVMIAAAMLGKKVFYRPSSYHKVPGIADFAFGSSDVTREEDVTIEQLRGKLTGFGRASLNSLPQDFFERHRETEITIVMLSYHRLEQTLNAIRSLTENVALPFKLLLIDNNSSSDERKTLREIASAHDFLELILLNENLGCAGGRSFALSHVETPYVLFIDNDIEVFPGTVEHLLHTLEKHKAWAVTGKVIFQDGTIHLNGGDYVNENGLLTNELLGYGMRLDDPLGPTKPCMWVPGCLSLFRRECFIDYPLETNMSSYYEDLEWCYRVTQNSSGTFYRDVESVAIHYHVSKLPDASLESDEKRDAAMMYLESIAHFYRVHGLVLSNVFDFVPDLGPPSALGIASARLLLELILWRGSDWVLHKWKGGELAPVFSGSEGKVPPEGSEKNFMAAQVNQFRYENELLKAELETIHRSNFWKAVTLYRRMRWWIEHLWRPPK